MHDIDNLGDGNCMYYAYSISLVYYLRAQQNLDVAHQLLGRLELTDQNKTTIITIIQNSSNLTQVLTYSDILDIQNILGAACRKFTAKAVEKEFSVENYTATTLYAASAYNFRQYIHAQISPDIRPYVGLTTEQTSNLSGAEINKPEHSLILEKMKMYLAEKIKSTEELFLLQCGEHLSTVESKDSSSLKCMVMDKILNDLLYDFFTLPDAMGMTNLKRYTDTLGTDYIWACEDSLHSLNTAMSGETRNRLSDDTVAITQDNPLKIIILHNGAQLDHTMQADIILKHVYGNHWISVIPKAFLDCPNIPKYSGRGFFYSAKKRNDLDVCSTLIGAAITGAVALACTGHIMMGIILCALIVCAMAAMITQNSNHTHKM